MFIQRDTRKILQILHDEKLDHTSLNFSRRAAEFGGSTEEFFSPTYASKFASTKNLNLYKNQLQHIVGISNICRANAPIEILSLGCNLLSSLPNSFAGMHTLRELWLDNNRFEVFPEILCEMKELKVLVLSNNNIREIPRRIKSMYALEDLSLDGNELSSLPNELFDLPNLRALRLRGNKLTQLPEAIENCTSLETLVLASNELTNLPKSLGSCSSLKVLSINSNKLQTIPASLARSKQLSRINAANNQISFIPLALLSKWRSSFPKEITEAGHLLLLKYIEVHILPTAVDSANSERQCGASASIVDGDSDLARNLSETFGDTNMGSPDKNSSASKKFKLPDVSHVFSPQKKKKFALTDEVVSRCITIAGNIGQTAVFSTDFVSSQDLDLTLWLHSLRAVQAPKFSSPTSEGGPVEILDPLSPEKGVEGHYNQLSESHAIVFRTPVKSSKSNMDVPKSLLSAVKSPFTPMQNQEEPVTITLLLDGNPVLSEANLALSSIQETISTGINTLTESQYEMPLVAEIRKKMKK